MVAIFLLLAAASLLLAAFLFSRRVPPNRVCLALLVLTVPIATEDTIAAVSVNLALSDTILIALVMYGLAVAAVSKARLRLPLIAPITALFLWVLLSLLIGINRFGSGSSSLHILSLLKFVVLFSYFIAIVNLIHSKEDLHLLLHTWLLTGTLVATLGISDSILNLTTGRGLPFLESTGNFRAHGTFENANLFASYSCLSFFLASTLLIKTRAPLLRLLIALCMTIQMLAILFSGSRGGTVAFMASLMCLGTICGSNRFRLPLLSMAAIPLLLFFALPPAAAPFQSTLDPLVNRLVSTQDFHTRAHLQRYFLWTQAISFFDRSPIFGIGRGNYQVILAKETGVSKIPHNTFLGILAETGLPGLGLFVVFVSPLAAVLAKRIMRKRSAPTEALMATCMLSALIAVAIQGMTNNLENFRGFWMLLGVIHAFNSLYPVHLESAGPGDSR